MNAFNSLTELFDKFEAEGWHIKEVFDDNDAYDKVEKLRVKISATALGT